MIKVLFICHGNICRSPMAEYLFRDLLKKYGAERDFCAESRAVSSEESGNPVHPGTKKVLDRLGISCKEKRAQLITKADCDEFDYLVLMDQKNERWLRPYLGKNEKKVSLLLNWCGEERDVADPWYTGDFEATYRDVSRGCEALLKALLKKA